MLGVLFSRMGHSIEGILLWCIVGMISHLGFHLLGKSFQLLCLYSHYINPSLVQSSFYLSVQALVQSNVTGTISDSVWIIWLYFSKILFGWCLHKKFSYWIWIWMCFFQFSHIVFVYVFFGKMYVTCFFLYLWFVVGKIIVWWCLF